LFGLLGDNGSGKNHPSGRPERRLEIDCGHVQVAEEDFPEILRPARRIGFANATDSGPP